MFVRLAAALVVSLSLCGVASAQMVLGENFSHSLDTDTVGPSVVCTFVTPLPAEGWARLIEPEKFGVTGDLEITSVSFGLNTFAGVGFDDQDIDIVFHEWTGDDHNELLFDDMDEISRETISVEDFDNGEVVTFELDDPVFIDAGTNFVIEIEKPDYSDLTITDRTFSVGANALGQTAVSWYIPRESDADPPNDCTDFLEEPIDTHAEIPGTAGVYLGAAFHFLIEVGFIGGCVAPTSLLCEEDGDDIILTWLNSGTYTEIEVFRDGELLETLTKNENEYLDTEGSGSPVYTLVCTYNEGDIDCTVESAPCKFGAIRECSSPDSIVSDTVDNTTDIIDIDAEFEVGDIDVEVEITHTWIGDLSVDLESPAGTTIRLFGPQTEIGQFENVDVVFDDDGIPFEMFLLPHGTTMQVDGFGTLGGDSLAEFDGEDIEGEWTLTIDDNTEANDGVDDPPFFIVSHGSGTFEQWCIRASAAGEKLFLRGDINSNGSVSALIDALFLLQYQFAGGPEPECQDAADVDGNNTVSALLDSLFLLNYGFSGGPEPADPFPDCGLDDDLDGDVDCSNPPAC